MDAFTVNLDQETGGQYLQVILSLEVEDAHMGDKIKTYTPKLRNDVIRLLSGKKASELVTKEGKETLATEIRSLMNEVLEPGRQGRPGQGGAVYLLHHPVSIDGHRLSLAGRG